MTQSSQNSAPSPFQFQTEFTPDGDVIGGPKRKYVLREEADQIAANARADGEAKAQAKGIASMDRVVGHLAPVSAQLAQIADALRQEAAELALIAARKIAGDALDKAGAEAAANAIAEAVKLLKGNPVVTVSVAPDSVPEVQRRLEQLRQQGRAASLSFIADPSAKPGDWRVEWDDGAVGFSREQVEAAIDAVIKARLQDPVEPQLELFSAA
jgi:flagellar assembly protein FliH